MKKQHLSAAIAILILLVLVVVFFPRDSAPEQQAADETRGRRAATTTTGKSDKSRKRSDDATTDGQSLMEHQVADLSQFILPLVEGYDVTLKEAVKILMEAYKDTCRRSHTQPLALEFLLPDKAGAKLRFSIERGDFQAALAHLAALGGYTVKCDGLLVTFAAVDGSPLTNRETYRMKPGFQGRLKLQLQRQGISHDGSLGGMMVAAGLVEPGCVVGLNPVMLQLDLTPAESLRIETWQAALPSSFLIKASVLLIHAEKPLDLDVSQYTSEQVRGLLSSQPGVRLSSFPSATIRDGQEAIVESGTGQPNAWSGMKFTIAAERGGLAFFAKDTTEYRPDDGKGPPVRVAGQAVLRDGEPQLSLVKSSDGDYLYRLLAMDLVDSTGRPARDLVGLDQGIAESASYPVAAPNPGNPGTVVSPYSGQLIDVSGYPSGSLVRDPAFPVGDGKVFRVP